MDKPSPRNKLSQNIESYQKERNLFLDKQYAFKFGDVKYGVGAVSLIRSMYMELIYSVHFSLDEKECEEFLKRLWILYDKAASLQNDNDVKTSTMAVGTEEGRRKFIPVVKELDLTYCELKRLERKCGFE